jgi:hypothetical protein
MLRSYVNLFLYYSCRIELFIVWYLLAKHSNNYLALHPIYYRCKKLLYNATPAKAY